ncbi:MAG: hypothetical protein QW112_00425 [Candidatus Micrarchaeia archaeon]
MKADGAREFQPIKIKRSLWKQLMQYKFIAEKSSVNDIIEEMWEQYKRDNKIQLK